MSIFKHESMALGNPNQQPGKHREHQVDNGRYGYFLGQRDRCDADYYLFEVIGERSEGNDPNSRRI